MLYFQQLIPILLLSLYFASLPVRASAPVVVVDVQVGALPEVLELTGNVKSIREVDIGAEVAGQVAQVFVEQGDVVKTGQMLVQLRDAPTRWRLQEVRAQLQSNQARVKLALLEEQRQALLLKRGSVSANVYDQIVARLQQARAEAAARKAEILGLEDKLQRHKIIAPFTGIVARRHVEKGGWLDTGDIVIHVASMEHLKLELAVPQHYFQQLHINPNEIDVTVYADGKLRLEQGNIERVVAFADNSRNFYVWVTLDNANHSWIPGMSAQATLRWSGNEDSLLLLPNDALVRRADGSTIVWKVVPGKDKTYKVVPVAVTPGHSTDNLMTVISEKLHVGEQVVVRGNETLQPEQSVRFVTGEER